MEGKGSTGTITLQTSVFTQDDTTKQMEHLNRQIKNYRELMLIMVSLLIGIVVGYIFTSMYHTILMNKSAKLGGIVIDDKAYMIKPYVK